MKHFFADEQQLQQFAKKIAHLCHAPFLIFLKGELGVGKTTFARAFIQSLGISDKVKSPTYQIVESYRTTQQLIFHFDLYRIHNPLELDEFGIDDYFKQSAIFLIEWPERGGNVLPTPDLEFLFEIKDQGRDVTMVANTEKGKALLALK